MVLVGMVPESSSCCFLPCRQGYSAVVSLLFSCVTAADLNNIKFSAYRTAMKLRRVQKALRRE